MRPLPSPLVLACVALCGCGTSSTPGGDASLDAAGESSTSSDASTGTDAGGDASSDASAGDAGCGTACRLFSVYCNTAPCTCVSLASTEPDPTCDAGTVSCVVDPCGGKTAVCQAGACAVK